MTSKRGHQPGAEPSERHRRGRFWAPTLIALLALVSAACGTSGDDEAGSAMDGGFEETTEDADAIGVSQSAAEPESTIAPSAADVGEIGEAAEEESAEAGADEEAAEDDAAAEEEPDAEQEASDQLGAGGAAVTPTAADLGRKLIFTAQVEVGVDDVAAASAEATRIVEDLGGFLFGQNTVGGAQPSSELVFKVLPDDFNRALEALGAVGELRNQSVSTDDVTERIVDLESRIEVAELGVQRLRTSLETTTDLDDFAQVERLLLDRETELELLRGQLRTLQDRVDLATITLTVTQDRVENRIDLTITSYEGHDGGEACPGQGDQFVEAGSPVTVCFDIVNLGDQTLTDVTLTDTVLEIDADTELIPVFGSVDELAPGQSATVAYEATPERPLRLRTRVVATPTDGVSSDPAGPAVNSQVNYDLRTFEPERDPGFGDGFSVAVDVLRTIWVALTVVIGFLVPMLVLTPVMWLLWRARKEYRNRRPPRSRPGLGAPTPPPPGPTPPPPRQEVAVPAGTVSGSGTGSKPTGDADSGEGAH